MSTEEDVAEVEALIAADSDEVLEAKLHRFHRMKLSFTCLSSQKNRDKVDHLVSLIIAEKRRRDGEPVAEFVSTERLDVAGKGPVAVVEVPNGFEPHQILHKPVLLDGELVRVRGIERLTNPIYPMGVLYTPILETTTLS